MEQLKYGHILNFVYETPWAILPSKMAIILDLLSLRASGGMLTEEEIQARIGAVAKPQNRNVGAIAVLPLFGTIIPRGNMMMESSGATSVERFTQQFRQAMADPQVGGVLVDIDSPGGNVQGVAELADEIHAARGVKPIAAIANSLAASAAYWIGTSADELSVTPTGEVGSIGVFAAHEDISALMEKRGVKTTIISEGKYKTEGHPYGPLDDEARAAIQERVGEYYGMFIDAVGRNRGVAASDVRAGFGEGRVVGAKKAKQLRMADYVETMDGAMQRLARRMMKGASGNAKAEDEPMVFQAIEMTEAEKAIIEQQEAYLLLLAQAGGLDLRRRRLKLAGK